ncbi:MAG TPA: DUF1573 domain-containing protein [Candidatus Aquilonibacter sp.]|nr:DUF1573 domain-containing protein [Candidatus Aquilonibacter sp.]
MKLRRAVLFALAGIVFLAAGIFAAGIKSTNGEVVSQPVYVPSMSQINQQLPDGVLAWNSLRQSTNAAADQVLVHFIVGFTNVSDGKVAILDVHPSCGCTTTELPTLPWVIEPGASGEIPVTVNVEDKIGSLFKFISISTDKGLKELSFQINMMPPVVPTMTAAQRAEGIEAAKIDRQAVFRADCATCHVQRGQGKYGMALYEADCAICHEAEPRATMVPDLHNLKVPTNDDFWRTWIAHGKPGSFMPAFAQSDGGPLSDMQIASLAAYLDYAIPPHIPPPPQ